jgi:hypothetical protein
MLEQPEQHHERCGEEATAHGFVGRDDSPLVEGQAEGLDRPGRRPRSSDSSCDFERTNDRPRNTFSIKSWKHFPNT